MKQLKYIALPCTVLLLALAAPTPSHARPCACSLICFPPSCDSLCCLPDGSLTTCSAYGCGDALRLSTPQAKGLESAALSLPEFLASLGTERQALNLGTSCGLPAGPVS
jgi:hypothetical protein